MMIMMLMMLMMMMISGRSSILEIVFLIQECLKPATNQSYDERTGYILHHLAIYIIVSWFHTSQVTFQDMQLAALPAAASPGIILVSPNAVSPQHKWPSREWRKTRSPFCHFPGCLELSCTFSISWRVHEWIIQGFLLERDNYWTPLEEAAPWQLLPPVIPSNYPEIYLKWKCI